MERPSLPYFLFNGQFGSVPVQPSCGCIPEDASAAARLALEKLSPSPVPRAGDDRFSIIPFLAAADFQSSSAFSANMHRRKYSPVASLTRFRRASIKL